MGNVARHIIEVPRVGRRSVRDIAPLLGTSRPVGLDHDEVVIGDRVVEDAAGVGITGGVHDDRVRDVVDVSRGLVSEGEMDPGSGVRHPNEGHADRYEQRGDKPEGSESAGGFHPLK